jgi:hypothetical protein
MEPRCDQGPIKMSPRNVGTYDAVSMSHYVSFSSTSGSLAVTRFARCAARTLDKDTPADRGRSCSTAIYVMKI